MGKVSKILHAFFSESLEGQAVWGKRRNATCILGTKSDYEEEYGNTPIGKLVRKIAGLDRQAVNKAFSDFLSEEKMNTNQIRFVKLIIDYIVANGMIADNDVFMQEPSDVSAATERVGK